MDVGAIIDSIASAKSWEERVSRVRHIPEELGTAEQLTAFTEIAKHVYAKDFESQSDEIELKPDFASVYWTSDYELERVETAYRKAHELTDGFVRVAPEELSRALLAAPESVLAFRLILGLTTSELAQAAKYLEPRGRRPPISKSRIESAEAGKKIKADIADRLANIICQALDGKAFGDPPTGAKLKVEKPDTLNGWQTVREFATKGAPYPLMLHQRLYGGAFNQLLNATGHLKGNVLEDAVANLFEEFKIEFVRTGSHNQREIKQRFGMTVKPAPDFVIFDRRGTLRAIIECKVCGDGGTARDKAARFAKLRAEATRLNGIPVVAMLSGVGWQRAGDALGPVVRDTDGRVFTPATIREMVKVEPFSSLVDEALRTP